MQNISIFADLIIDQTQLPMDINEATRAFIQAHRDDDVRYWALRGCKDTNVNLPFALQQIEGRQKAREKLPEHYALDEILYPATLSLEQCSPAATAHYKANLVAGDSIADLSGGFGVDTFAFARHFQRCQYVEPQMELCDIARHNAKVFGLHNITFLQGTMEERLGEIGMVDWLYIDPSRRDTHGRRVVALEECTPDLTQWLDKLRAHTRKGLLIKLSPLIDITRALRQLPGTRTVHTVAVNGECKEILFLLDTDNPCSPESVSCTAVNIQREKTHSFTFTQEEEANTQPKLTGEPCKYIYEPNAAILKAGAFKCIASRFDLLKLHPHSHLYTHDKLIPDFPGRTFMVEQTIPFNKNARKEVAKKAGKANVSVRNFPLTAEELKKNLKVKDGGDIYIWGTTLSGGGKALLLCRKC